MTVMEAIRRLRGAWHGSPPLASFEALDRIEASCARPLPADYKFFLQWFSDGGEGRLPGGYLSLYQAAELLEIQATYEVPKMGNLFVFATDGGGVAFAFDLSRNVDGAAYPVVTYSLSARDPELVEDAGRGFGDFLERLLLDRSA